MVAAGASKRGWTAPSVNVGARSDPEGPIPRPALPGTSPPDQSQLSAAATPTKASGRKKHAPLRPHSSDRQFEGGRFLSGDAHQEHRLGHIGTDKLPSPSSKHRGRAPSKIDYAPNPITSSIVGVQPVPVSRRLPSELDSASSSPGRSVPAYSAATACSCSARSRDARAPRGNASVLGGEPPVVGGDNDQTAVLLMGWDPSLSGPWTRSSRRCADAPGTGSG